MTQPPKALLLILLLAATPSLAQQDALLKACKATRPSTPSPELTQAIDDLQRGDIPLATTALNQALALDRCSAQAHLVASRLLSITGNPTAAAQQLTLAHQLAPKDTTITEAWKRQTQAPKSRPDCRLTTTPTPTSLTLQPRGYATTFRQGAELAVTLNGNPTRLVLDTGDPAITLSADEAQRANLIPERTFQSGPHTATGSNTITAYTSHIHRLQLGPITLEDCPVNVVVDPPLPFGGGIGLQLLHNFLLTLDIQNATLTLDPLPPLPTTPTINLTTLADSPVPDNLRTWLPFYDPPALNRIVIPTRLNNNGTYLFLLDTGAPLTNITPDAAQEVTTLARDFQTRISGYGGAEAEVYSAARVQLRVGPVSRRYAPMLSLPNAARSNASDIRISGILGFDWVRDLILRIDYRDQRLDLQPHP